MKIERIILLLALFSLPTLHYTFAQELVWKAGFYGFLDNREYFNDYALPGTIFGSRSEGQIGIKINDNQGFYTGASYLYEFGADWDENPIVPILYFHFHQPAVNFYIGSFPRHSLIQLPELLLTDTVEYYRPNIQGIFVNFKKSWGSQNVWLDWTSRQTDTRRETFALGATGILKAGILYYRHDFIMFHFAGPAVRIPNDPIRDNGGGSINVGVDLSQNANFDTLSFQTGYVLSYDQLRDVYEVRFAKGFRHELNIGYRNLGIRSILYHGDSQELMLGDHLYRAKFYNRTDVYWRMFNKSGIQGRIEFGFHKTPEVLDLHQKLVVRVNLGNSFR